MKESEQEVTIKVVSLVKNGLIMMKQFRVSILHHCFRVSILHHCLKLVELLFVPCVCAFMLFCFSIQFL